MISVARDCLSIRKRRRYAWEAETVYMDDSPFVVTVFPVVLHSNPGEEALLGEFKPLILRGKSNM